MSDIERLYKMQAEIERLRRQLENEAYSTEEAINKRDAGIGRLRDLLGDILQRAMLPEDIEQRVREALGDKQ